MSKIKRCNEAEITEYKLFNLGFNIYVPRGTFANHEDFRLWLLHSGCIVVNREPKTSLVIYDRLGERFVISPKEIFKWMFDQYMYNKKGAHVDAVTARRVIIQNDSGLQQDVA